MARSFLLPPRLRRVFERIDPSGLSFSAADTELSPADVGLEAQPLARTHLALGVYSPDGLQRALREYGFFDRLAERGLEQVELRLGLEDPFRPRFVIWSVPHGVAVVDLTVSQARGAQVGLPGELSLVPLLFVEAIQLQHPSRKFEWSRPPLPGQERPGLSLFPEIMEMLALLARRVGAQGVALVPSSFHAAWIYERYFQFVEPAARDRFEALRYSVRLRPLWLLSWAIALGCVLGPDGERLLYAPSPMLCPLTDALAQAFGASGEGEPSRRPPAIRFEIDWELLRQRFPWPLMPPEPPPERIHLLLGDHTGRMTPRGGHVYIARRDR